MTTSADSGSGGRSVCEVVVDSKSLLLTVTLFLLASSTSFRHSGQSTPCTNEIIIDNKNHTNAFNKNHLSNATSLSILVQYKIELKNTALQ